MKKHILIILALMLAPFISNAQSDCSLDFIWELVDQAVSVQAVDVPEGASLTFTINGQEIESVDDAILISGLALIMPMTVCVEYISSDCPDGVELCETVSVDELLNGGGNDPIGCYDEAGVFYEVGAEVFVSECEFYYCEGLNNWSAIQVIPGCGDVLGCESDNGDLYLPGEQLEVSTDFCENYTCVAAPATGLFDFVLNADLYPAECAIQIECDHSLAASMYEFSSCTWEFSVLADGEFAQVVWDFGDGETSYDGYSVLHDFAEDGEYLVSVTYWSADCGLMTLEANVIVEGCGDVIAEGCYDELGVFYSVGDSLYLNDCEFLLCEGPGNWSGVMEDPNCIELW